MKKIVRLTESELITIVKRVISENFGKTPKFKKIIIDYINKLVEGGLYVEEGDYPNDEYVLFRKKENNEIVFRYSMEDGKLLYSDKINIIPHVMLGDSTWKLIPNKYVLIGEIVREWVDENLVPKFSEDVEEITWDEFRIGEIYNDENFNHRHTCRHIIL